jgi:hypothetical protein
LQPPYYRCGCDRARSLCVAAIPEDPRIEQRRGKDWLLPKEKEAGKKRRRLEKRKGRRREERTGVREGRG